MLGRTVIFFQLFNFGSGVQLLVHNRALSEEGAEVFRAVPEEIVPLVGWKKSMSPALLDTRQLSSLP